MNIKTTPSLKPSFEQPQDQTTQTVLKKKEETPNVDYRSKEMCQILMTQACEEAFTLRHQKIDPITEEDMKKYKAHIESIPQKIKDEIRDSYIGLR